jgi:hypothetical protein
LSESLLEYFSAWIDDLDGEVKGELLPKWVDDCIVIGEIPNTGNYLLVPTAGEKSGHVIKFEHDGFEFIDQASSMDDFILSMLKRNSEMFTNMASHMTFTESNEQSQWWVKEIRDNRNNIAV